MVLAKLVATLLITLFYTIANASCIYEMQKLSDIYTNCNTIASSCDYDGDLGATRMRNEPMAGLASARLYICDVISCGPGPEIWGPIGSVQVYYEECGSASHQVKKTTELNECPRTARGSVIHLDNQALGEFVPVTGAPFQLSYFSYRSLGRKAENTIEIPLTLGTLPEASQIKVDLYNEVGTLIDTQTYTTLTTNMVYSYTWNGLDASTNPTSIPLKFKAITTETIYGSNAPTDHEFLIGIDKQDFNHLGGWVPSIQHYYDKISGILYMGDGSTRKIGYTALSAGKMQIPESDGSLVYEFNANGTHEKTRSGLKGTTLFTFNYTASGLSTIVELFSRTTTFTRDGSGNLTSITSPSGKVTNVTLDGNGYLATVTNSLSEVYTMTYTSLGLLSSFQKPNGTIGTFTYDGVGRLTDDSSNSGFSSYIQQIINMSNPAIKGQSITSAEGRIKTVENDPNGYLTVYNQQKTTLPNGKVQILNRNPDGNASDFLDGQLTYSTVLQDHGRFGPLAKEKIGVSTPYSTFNYYNSYTLSNPADPFTTINWTQNITDNGANYTTVYTSSNSTFTTTSTNSRTSKVKIDSYERPIETQRGSLTKTSFTYTNKELMGIAQGVRTTTLAYNATTHLLTSITNPLSQVTSFTYDNAERLTTQTLPDTRVINYLYDSNGNLTSVTPSGGSAHILAYGLNELLNTYAAPTGLTPVVETTYVYNDDKQITDVTKSNGKDLKFTYNSTTGLLTQIASPNVLTPLITWNYTYDTLNPEFVTGMTSSTGITTTLGYTGGVSTSYTNTTSNVFDDSSYSRTMSYNKLSSENVLGIFSTYFGYDGDNLLTTASNMSLVYNTPNGLLTSTTLGGTTETYTYNTFGEHLTYKGTTTGSTAAYNYTLTRDNLGRVLTKTEKLNGLTQAVFEYRYDSAGRLDQVKKDSVIISTYTYDGNNNRTASLIGGTSISATYDVKDQMTASGVFNYTYDANGFLLTKTNTLTSQVTTYAYDAFGNLASVTLPSSDVVSYEYDGLGHLFVRKYNGTVTRYYTWNPEGQLVGEMDNAGTPLRKYTYATKGNIPDFFTDGTDEFRIYSDQIGSPRVVVKVATGAVQYKMQHDEFGRVILNTIPGYLPFGFAGGFYDKDTGLVKFGARTYDPETGRWLSKDPILFQAGHSNILNALSTIGKPEIEANLYGYSWSDPINFIDLNGESPAVVAVAGAIVVGSAVIIEQNTRTPLQQIERMAKVSKEAGGQCPIKSEKQSQPNMFLLPNSKKQYRIFKGFET